METSEIRDKLLEQRAIHQQALKAAEEELAVFERVIGSITDEQKEIMIRVLGEKYFDLSIIDLQRLCKDKEYLVECQARFDVMVAGLHSYLEEEINV